MKSKNNSALLKILLIANIFFALLLILSYSAPYINPQKIWFIAFIGLLYPFLLIVNLLFVILWLIKFKKYVLISLLSIIIGYNHINSIYKINFSDDIPNDSTFTVLSYNIRLFNIYEYQRKDIRKFEPRNQIISYIINQKPDIICFQEFFYDKSGFYKTVDTIILKSNNMKYYYTSYIIDNEKYYYSGVATFSKYPIIDCGILPYSKKTANKSIFTDIVKGDDTLRIFNVHLESNRLNKTDEKFYQEFLNHDNQDEIKKGTRKILSKIKRAFINRSTQAIELQKNIEQSPYPVIVCGDFNDTPISYTYRVVSKNLKDAFIENGKGIGITYNGKFPSYRIDYILHDENFISTYYRKDNINISDHFPIIAKLKLNEKKGEK
jgi:endonuclease/exonuclease/phosphatase family metal-dependent hydrolase